VLFIESTASTASLSDEAVYLIIESVVGGLHFCKRVRSPYCLRGPYPLTIWACLSVHTP